MLRHLSARRPAGFTLIELLVVVVIGGVLLASAIPAFQNTIDRNRLKGVAETTLSDLELMRLESIKRNQSVFLSIRNDTPTTGNWCYGMSNTGSCNCQSTNCTIDNASKVVSSSNFPGIKIAAPSTTSPTPFDFSIEQVRGQVTLSASLTNNRIRLTSARGYELDIEVSTLGRFIICSPSGSNTVSGYPTCS